MGLRFSREDVRLGAIPVGAYVTSTSTTPAPTGLTNRALDWGVLPPGTTGQVLTVQSDNSLAWKSSSVFNVRDYGAKGDGGTDDAVAIQAAITAAAGVGAVYLPSGTYLVNNSCKLPSHSRIYGDGDASIITPGPSFLSSGRPAPLEATGAGFSNIVIEHLNVQGSTTNAHGAHNISLQSTTTLSNIIVRDLTSCNAGSTGVLIYCVTTGSDILIDNVEASNNANDGVEVCSVGLISNCTIVNCHCNNNARSGIDLASNCNQVIVSNNQCVGNALFGIYTDGGQTPMNFSCIISNNVICGGSTATGLAATFTRYTQILNNDISLCTEGIALVNSTDCLIQGNTIYQNSVRGINCDVSGNYVVNPPAGVARDTNGALYRIVDTALAAFMTPSRVSIIGNHILDNTSNGIWIKNGQYWLIMGNAFQNTASPGVQTLPIYTKYAPVATFPAWVSGTAYTTGSLVSDGGSYYQSLASHTATAGDEPGVGASWATHWILSLVQPWVTGTVYAIGAATWVSSAFYVCTAAHTSGSTTQPGVGVSWASCWALQTVTLDNFIFSHNFSSGHTTSDAITWAGTNGQILMQQGTISAISSPGAGASSEQFGAGATTGTAVSALAVGAGASVAKDDSVAIGAGASCNSSSYYSVALGPQAASSQSNNIAIGRSASATGSPAIALGYRSVAASNVIAFGATTNSSSWFTDVNIAGSSSGVNLNLQGSSSTAGARNCGVISSSFNTSTDATWSGNLLLYAGDHTANRLGVQVQSNGSAALVGFFGAAPVIQPPAGAGSTTVGGTGGTAVTSGSTFTGGGTAAYTIDDLVNALKALGLLTA